MKQKKPLIETICSQCKTKYFIKTWRAKRYKNHFCKPDCFAKFMSSQKKELSRNFKGGDLTKSPSHRFRARLKLKIFEKLGGAYCVNCGCDEIKYLEVNHIYGGGHSEYKRITNALFYDAILKDKVDCSKLNILCRVCNALDYIERKNKSEKGKHKLIWEKVK